MKTPFKSGIRFAVTAAGLVTASPVWAHPGHEHPVTPPGSPFHWFIEPSHFIGWVGLACVALVLGKVCAAWVSRAEEASPASEKHSN